MTVREAFEKAGYPVPDDAKIVRDWCYSCNEDEWAWHSPTRYAESFSKWKGKRLAQYADIVWLRRATNLTNLPAIDAYDVLPGCVRKALDDVAA
jgi:hypothetical protein